MIYGAAGVTEGHRGDAPLSLATSAGQLPWQGSQGYGEVTGVMVTDEDEIESTKQGTRLGSSAPGLPYQGSCPRSGLRGAFLNRIR